MRQRDHHSKFEEIHGPRTPWRRASLSNKMEHIVFRGCNNHTVYYHGISRDVGSFF